VKKKTEVRSQKSGLAICGLAVLAMSCASEPKGPSLREKEDMMMSDPMGYKMEHVDTDITGGGTTQFDKEAFKRDMDHVANP
jgi:hypothetical protein